MTDAACSSWSKVAYRFARHWGCDESDADDVAQEALLLALMAGDRAFSHAWFFVITRRLASRLRARARHEFLCAAPSAPQTLPDDSRLLVNEIRNLASLRRSERNLLQALLNGSSQAEIGAVFGWGTKSVGVRVRRLVRKIRQAMSSPTRDDRRGQDSYSARTDHEMSAG